MYLSLEKFQKYSNVYCDNPKLQESYIESAEDIVEDYLGYKLSIQKYETLLNGLSTNELQLKAKPINEILSVEINGKSIDVSEFYAINEFIYYNGIFPEGWRNIKVVYTTGYKKINVNEDNTCHCKPLDLIDGGNANKEDDTEDIDTDIEIEDNTDNETEIENDIEEKDDEYNIPKIIIATILRIATLLQTESDSNIGITSKYFGDSGTRTFTNYTNFDKYLSPISNYRIIRI
jgi:hypothetical protein